MLLCVVSIATGQRQASLRLTRSSSQQSDEPKKSTPTSELIQPLDAWKASPQASSSPREHKHSSLDTWKVPDQANSSPRNRRHLSLDTWETPAQSSSSPRKNSSLGKWKAPAQANSSPHNRKHLSLNSWKSPAHTSSSPRDRKHSIASLSSLSSASSTYTRRKDIPSPESVLAAENRRRSLRSNPNVNLVKGLPYYPEQRTQHSSPHKKHKIRKTRKAVEALRAKPGPSSDCPLPKKRAKLFIQQQALNLSTNRTRKRSKTGTCASSRYVVLAAC